MKRNDVLTEVVSRAASALGLLSLQLRIRGLTPNGTHIERFSN